MNTQLTLTKTAKAPGATVPLEFTATLHDEGVTVSINQGLTWGVDWGYIDDVEFLAELFFNAEVWEFRQIILLLVEAKAARHMFA